MGAVRFLEELLPGFASCRRKDLGTNRRTHRRHPFVRLFRGQCSTGCGALERRHQLWRRHRVHLRRPARASDNRHLPQVLRLESRRADRRCFLCCHVCRCSFG